MAQNEEVVARIRVEYVNGDAIRQFADNVNRASADIKKNGVELTKLAAESRRTSQAFASSTGASSGFFKSVGGGGNVIRNASAQFQDFAVQIQGGQDAMRAFAQQAPQLFSAFGVFGTVLGTVIAITAALPALQQLFNVVTNTSKPFKDALEDLNDAMARVGETGHDFKLDDFIEEFNAADKGVRKSMVAILEWQAQIAKLKDEQLGKSATQSIQDALIPTVGGQALQFFNAIIEQDQQKLIDFIKTIGDDFGGAQKTLVDGLKISEEAARDLVTQLNFFKQLPEDDMRRIITLFEKAGNTKFDGLVKNLYQIREAAIAVADQQKKTNKTLGESKGAIASGTDLLTDKDREKLAGKKEKGDIVFNNEQLKVSEAIIKRIREEFGLTRAQASAFSGNLFTESQGFQTNIKENLSGNDPRQAAARKLGGGFGLAQWSGIRKTQLKEFAAQMGKDVGDLSLQLDFLVKELYETKFGKETIASLKKIDDLSDAAVAVRKKFEKPNAELAHDDRRIKATKAAFIGDATESERQFDFEAEKKALKEVTEHAKKYEEVLADIASAKSFGSGSIQENILEEQSKAYKKLGIDVNNLTEATKAEKEKIDETIRSRAQNIELMKLESEQAKKARENFEDIEKLKAEIKELNIGVIDSEQFNEELGKIHDRLKLGILTPDEAKALQDSMVPNLESRFGDVKEGYSEMSEFAKEAARNMQDAFADFLFDPFKDGIKGMADNFVNILRRMAAEAVAAKIFEGLMGKDGSGSGGLLDKGVGLLSKLFGAFGGGGGVASAKGNVFDQGNVIPFAMGGVVSRATKFPMANGRMGLMGESGPEAILPLRRGADGRLGISSDNRNSGHTYNISQNINVENGDPGRVRQAAGSAIREAMSINARGNRYR